MRTPLLTFRIDSPPEPLLLRVLDEQPDSLCSLGQSAPDAQRQVVRPRIGGGQSPPKGLSQGLFVRIGPGKDKAKSLSFSFYSDVLGLRGHTAGNEMENVSTSLTGLVLTKLGSRLGQPDREGTFRVNGPVLPKRS